MMEKEAEPLTRGLVGALDEPSPVVDGEVVGLPIHDGVLESVDPDSTWGLSGLRAGDTVTRVDKADVSDTRTVADILKSYRSGEKVRLTIDRGGETKHVKVTLP
jgi:S1-C subfamily serine protease